MDVGAVDRACRLTLSGSSAYIEVNLKWSNLYMARQTIPVTPRALIQRINRILAKDGEQLKAVRGERAQLDLGEYYILELSRNLAFKTNVDLEALGKELGALRPYERLEAPKRGAR